MRRLIALSILCIPLAGIAQMQSAAGQAHALFERDWAWRLQRHPELATTVGEHRLGGGLSDTTLAACRAAVEHERDMLAAMRAIERARLDGQDRLSWDLFVDDKERKLALARFFPCDPYPVTFLNALPVKLPQLVAQMPFRTEEDYRRYLTRISALPRHVDGLIEQMREGMRTGWTAPKAAVRAVPAMLREMREQLAEGALAAPFGAIPATIDEQVREELAAAGPAALAASAAPALKKLEDFIAAEYLPAARDSIGASALPGGQPWYALLSQNATTTAQTPAEMHALGLKEVARLKAEATAAIAKTGFRGSFAQFAAFARSDPRLFYTEPEPLLARYRRVLERANARLPELFAELPREQVVVKPAQRALAGQQVAAYYEAGTPERVAALVVDTAHLHIRPMWEIETLALHEAVPGHHVQVARAHEIEGLPAFRRFGWYVAFGEGWALYAESLGPRIGFYRDSFSAFGHLNEHLFRAARLVVDTGIHALGWSRQQAIDYLNANTANPVADNELEVDRYIAQPGQALGYKIGQLRILALRERAEAALGHGFDIRRFHHAVIDNGALPLAILEREVNRWIDQQAKQESGPDQASTAGFGPPPARVSFFGYSLHN